MSDSVFDFFGEEDIYSFKKIGSFGRFSTSNSFPIEFFLTTLKASQLSNLTFARDIRPASTIDFDQLLQRDIDDQRVQTEIKPYITSNSLTETEVYAKTTFFPPLLVAAIPVKEKTMEEYYSNQTVAHDAKNCIVRTWDGLFKLTLKLEKNGYEIKANAAHEDVYSVSKEPAVIEFKLSDNTEKGIKLIVIDGQHRLKALNYVYEETPHLLSELAIPICILFAPNATLEVANKKNCSEFSTPKIPEIFRQLFVDVNKNAEQVGGHFNILLSEGNMGSLICRRFCSHILNVRNKEGLAQIEWNQKKKKLSTEINRKYYLTSIGVIEKSLSETFGKNRAILNYLIDFDDIKELVQPTENDDHLEYPKVTWDKFSLAQKKHLLEKIDNNIIPQLEKMFFETDLFKPAVECFRKELNILIAKSDLDQNGGIGYKPVIECILDYMPIPDGERYREAKHNLRYFEELIGDCKDGKCFPFLGYAIFQRSLFYVWLEILKVGRATGMPLGFSNSYYLSLLNEFEKISDELVSLKNSFCQSFIFLANKINPTNDVKLGLAYLILSVLSKKDNRTKFSLAFKENVEIRTLDNFQNEMQDMSFSVLKKYMDLYSKNRVKVFKANYQIDNNIDEEIRITLQEEDNKRKREERDFKDGFISKDQIANKFEELVDSYIKNDIEKAQADLRRILDLDLDVYALSEPLVNLQDEYSYDEPAE